MRIVVNDIAASYGGALTILTQFYNYIRQSNSEDEWIFVLSDFYLEETENIKIKVRSDVKKSGFHKIYFDFISGKKFLESLNPDVVLSLQNIITFGAKAPQYVYIHQSIPFQNVKTFSFLKKAERKAAFIQHIIGAFIKVSAKKSDGIFVQTEWMKHAVAEKAKIDISKIISVFPDVEVCRGNVDKQSASRAFFYPTNGEIYKNIDTIVSACDILKELEVRDYTVYLTLPKGAIVHTNIECVGYLDKNQMQQMYQKCTLIFPSYIETIGLPLVEAAVYGCEILVADCPYAKEVLSDYKNARYFEPFDSKALSELMKNCIEEKLTPQEGEFYGKKSEWEKLYKYITSPKK